MIKDHAIHGSSRSGPRLSRPSSRAEPTRHQPAELWALSAGETAIVEAMTLAGARYLIFGDHAVVFHGHVRPLERLSLWIEPTAENCRCVAAALDSIGMPLKPTQAKHLLKARAKLALPAIGLELLTHIAGLSSFDTAYANAVCARVLSGQGSAMVLSLPDLIHAKGTTGSAQDMEDIRGLANVIRP